MGSKQRMRVLSAKKVNLALCFSLTLSLLPVAHESFGLDLPLPPLPGDGRPIIEDPHKAERRVRPILKCGFGGFQPIDTSGTTLMVRCLNARNVGGNVTINVELFNPTSIRFDRLDITIGWFPTLGPYRQHKVLVGKMLNPQAKITIAGNYAQSGDNVPQSVDVRVNAFRDKPEINR